MDPEAQILNQLVFQFENENIERAAEQERYGFRGNKNDPYGYRSDGGYRQQSRLGNIFDVDYDPYFDNKEEYFFKQRKSDSFGGSYEDTGNSSSSNSKFFIFL